MFLLLLPSYLYLSLNTEEEKTIIVAVYVHRVLTPTIEVVVGGERWSECACEFARASMPVPSPGVITRVARFIITFVFILAYLCVSVFKI